MATLTDEKRQLEARHAKTIIATGRPDFLLLVVLMVMVAGCTLLVHFPVLSAQARAFDDEEAIIENPLVQNPSWYSVTRFFKEVTLSSVVGGYYRPLTLTSLMLDWAMGGRPDDFRAFHRTSLALHVGSTLLLVLLCHQIFGKPWIAGAAGLLFGLHPLTVEPVAWVMERKTILAAIFAFASLNAYVRYTRTKGLGWYGAGLALYLTSLLAKPTGTPLPIMMLLMDYWPLTRFNRRAVIEKIPFIMLAAVFAVLCVVCEHKVNPLSLPVKYSPLHLPLRLCWLAAFYPCKILLPIRLSSVYMLPRPLDLTNGSLLLAVAVVIAMVVALAISRRWTPAFWVSAAIFYVGLSPTMGFVEYSWVSASDKYAYLPAVGPLLLFAWLMERAWTTGSDGGRSARRTRLVAVVVLVAGLLSVATLRQTRRWQTTLGFYTYAIMLAPDSPHAYKSRGNAYSEQGDYDRAIRDHTRAIELEPDDPEAYNNRGNAYVVKGDYDLGIRDHTRAIELKPDEAKPYYNRGNAHRAQGDYERAVRDYTRAIELEPDCVEAYQNRGGAYGAKGDYERAVLDHTRVIELKPGDAHAYYNRAVSLCALRQYDRAWADIKTYRTLGGTPPPDIVKELIEATGQRE